MNHQQNLMNVAAQHASNDAVRILVQSINEAQALAAQQLKVMERSSRTYQKALAMEEGYSVSQVNVELVTVAAAAATHLSRVATDMVNLATVLQTLGVDISY